MYRHNVFISYSSHDRPWAVALYEALQRRRVECFFDRARLTPGRRWEPQLSQGVSGSKHFLVLWSDAARQSDWVVQELSRFKGEIDPDGHGVSSGDRLLFAVNLQGQNATLTGFQSLIRPELQQAYAGGSTPDMLSDQAQAEWQGVIDEIAAAAVANRPAITVPVAVLALTSKMFVDSPPRTPELSFVPSATADQFMGQIGAGSMADLERRYGASPFDWRPFGTDATIASLLDQLLAGADDDPGINAKLAALNPPQPPVRWEQIDVMTLPVDKLDEIVLRMAAPAPCLVLVDPISMFSDQAWRRFERLAACFRNPRAAIVFPTPSPTGDPLLFLRRCISAYGVRVLEGFQKPIPYDPNYASCGLNVGDLWDMRRLVLVGLGRHFAPLRSVENSALLGLGPGAPA